MALIKCPECAQRISSNAVSCPGCGSPTGRRAKVDSKSSGATAKAIGFVLILLGMGFTFSGSEATGGALIVVGFVAFIAGRFKD